MFLQLQKDFEFYLIRYKNIFDLISLPLPLMDIIKVLFKVQSVFRAMF